MSGIRPGPNHPVRPNVWVDTYDRLSAGDPADLAPADLEALADSAWLVCRLDESLVTRQQAYAGYLETRDERWAVAGGMAHVLGPSLQRRQGGSASGGCGVPGGTWPRSQKALNTVTSHSRTRN